LLFILGTQFPQNLVIDYFKNKLVKRRVFGVEQLVEVVGVETWGSDRLFPRYFFVLIRNERNKTRNKY